MNENHSAVFAEISATQAALTFAVIVVCLTTFYSPTIPTQFKERLNVTISCSYAGILLYILSTIANIAATILPTKILQNTGLILLIIATLVTLLAIIMLMSPTIAIQPLP